MRKLMMILMILVMAVIVTNFAVAENEFELIYPVDGQDGVAVGDSFEISGPTGVWYIAALPFKAGGYSVQVGDTREAVINISNKSTVKFIFSKPLVTDHEYLMAVISPAPPLEIYGGPWYFYMGFRLDVEISDVASKTSSPKSFDLKNFPNPFNPTTIIQFSLPKPAHTTLKVYDLQGREVATLLANEWRMAGQHSVDWNVTDFNLPSGVYIVHIQVDKFTKSARMMFLK